MKKIFKIIGITLVALILLLVASPFLFKGKIEELIKKTINNNINANVQWASVDLSLLRSFPDATVIITDLTVVNNAPFLGDTLASTKELYIEMGVKQLFKNTQDDPIQIDALTLDKANVRIKIDSLGNANYDIAKENRATTAQDTAASEPFVFNLKDYQLKKATISYEDQITQTFLQLKEVNHSGSGDFSVSQSQLDTQTHAVTSLSYGGLNYLENHDLDLQAVIAMDLDNQKYTFKENLAKINELPLQFEGFVQLLDDGNLMDLSFKTPDSDFKNFLAIIPKVYRANLDGVETSGDFRVSGLIKGKTTETNIPKLDIEIVSSNASFKYPNLPKRVNNINIDVKIKNDTGILELTYIEINDLRFKIDSDTFATSGTLRNLMGNMLVNLSLKGALDLGNLDKVYPLHLDQSLMGRLTVDAQTNFDMNSVDKQQYANIKSSGSASLSGFEYKTPELPNPINIQKADLSFNTGNISLNSFTATTGKSDIYATGSIKNLIPFIMSKEDLKGRFDVSSRVFDTNDFTSTDPVTTGKNDQDRTVPAESSVKIPDFLNASLSFKADKVIYDNLELSKTQGTLSIANEEAQISKLSSSIFGGTAGLSGNLSTRNGVPTFDMTLDLSSIDIDQSFKGLDMLQGLAPIAKALQGVLSTKINLKGDLDEKLSPILSTLSGNSFAEILLTDVRSQEMPLLNLLDSKLDFIDFNDLNLDKLTTNLSFENGKVTVRPFNFMVKDIKVSVSGGHSFTNEISYTLNLDLPANYLGNDVTGLLSKLTASEKENLSVDLPIALTGNFTKPNVQLDLKTATTALTNQIIEIQKQRAKDKVKDKLSDVLGGLLGGGANTTSTDSTTTAEKPKTPTQSNSTQEAIKDVAGDLLGGLLGKKKKTKEAVKDTLR